MSYDPYAYKPQPSGTTAVMTQPGQSTTSYHPLHAPVPPPGNYVMPAAQSHHVDLRAQEVQLEQQQHQSVRPPIGRWRDSICDCANNLFPSCYCVCCCYYGMWLVAQSKNSICLNGLDCFHSFSSFPTYSGAKDTFGQVFYSHRSGCFLLGHGCHSGLSYRIRPVYIVPSAAVLFRGVNCASVTHCA